MQYMGGKERQARHIVEQLLKYRGTATRYVEPFMGGASIFSRMAPHFPGSAYGSDVHPDLVLMWQAVLDGWEPPTELDRGRYDELRTGEPSAVRAFAGFGCSFGGKWFGGYASNARGDDFCGAARRGVLKKAAGLTGAHVTLGRYEDLSPGLGTLVYCDPPYAATTGYATGSFDSDRFWSVMREWADSGATVLVSEYTAPDWAEEVWRREAVKSLRKDSNTEPSVEKLFLVRPTPVSDPAPTVDVMDDGEVPVNDNTAAELDESDLDDVLPAEHQPGRPPAQAEVDYWQQQAREAAGRHLALAEHPASSAPIVGMDPVSPDVAIAEIRLPAAPGSMPTADEFLDPAEPEVELNVSGQPPARRNSKGQYLVVDPATGDFHRYKNGNPIGYTRATTFVKSLVDSKALNDWGKANVAMGASLRPDILRRAHRLTWEDHKSELLQIVDQLQTAAGAKVSADEGTFLHGFTELMDAGLKDWQQAPEAYQADLARYTEALKRHGLEPVPGLIERTVMIREFGGIVGTFDRIFYHRPSGSYVVGDLKTGKTLSYGIDEIHAQIWLYAHGVNQNGVYDWNTDTWRPLAHDAGVPNALPPLTSVREDVGVIIHMPVQGPEAGEVYVRKADLVKGRENAEECHRHRSRVKSTVEDFAVPEPTWEERFAGVTSGEHANQLWRLAKAEGITGIRLNDLITIARTAITSRVDTSS